MARNLEARQWGAALLREVVERAKEKGKKDSVLTRLAYVGAGRMDVIEHLAGSLGFYLVIQPPEEYGSGRWYAMGRNWKELVKAMVFHFWTAEDEELIKHGTLDSIDNLTRRSERRKKLKDMGLDAESAFTGWLCRHKVPPIESVCILAMCEGFKIEWREAKNDGLS